MPEMEQNVENKLEELDRISDLPIEICHEIVSRISTREAARTSVLSKTWNAIWHTIHVLNFKMALRGRPLYIPPGCKELLQREYRRRVTNFSNFVDRTLQSSQDHGAMIHKFGLQKLIMDSEISFPRIDGWLGSVCTNGGLHEMELVLKCAVNPQAPYKLTPAIAAAANTLVELTLRGHIEIDKAAPFNNHVLFTALKSLKLTFVSVNDEAVSNLCSSCPALEDLAFIFCRGLEHVKVKGLSKLNLLIIQDGPRSGLEKIHVDVPTLMNLTYGSVCMRSCEINIESCTNLENFYISGVDAVAMGRLLLVTEPFLLIMTRANPQLKSQIFQHVTNSKIVDIPGNQLENLHFSLRDHLLLAKMDIPNSSPEQFFGSRLLLLKIPDPRQLEANFSF